MTSTSAITQLFDYTVRSVVPEDIAAYAPGDPGYLNYVKAFTRIIQSRQLPERGDFDITETIGLTQWVEASKEKNPGRFRRFRVCINSIGMSLFAGGQYDSTGANYLVIRLLDDAVALDDRDLLQQLVPAFEQFHLAICEGYPEESPFILLGILLAKMRLGVSDEEADRLAIDIMKEESKTSGRVSKEFLWGCSYFNQLNGSCWLPLIDRLLEPRSETLKLLREILQQWREY